MPSRGFRSSLSSIVADADYWLLALAALIVAVLWIPSLGSSLWRDETATFWLVKDGLRAALVRSSRFQQWFPLYLPFAWLAVKLAGASELALRLPSLIAALAAAAFVYRLGKRLLGAEAAWIAVVLFACFPEVIFAAADARPYALALVAFLASADRFLEWAHQGRLRDGLVFAVAAAATVYSHFLFAAAFGVLALYAALGGAERRKPRWGQIGVVAAVFVLLVLPIVPRALALWGHREILVWNGRPPWDGLRVALAPPTFVYGALAGLALALALRPKLAALSSQGFFLACWGLLPYLVYFALARWTSIHFFLARYLLWAAAGRALFFAWLTTSITPASARRLVALGFAAVSLFEYRTWNHSFEDLREASRLERSVALENTPVLVPSGYYESLRPGWLQDPELTGYLFSPWSFYPLAGRVVRLPLRLGAADSGYLEDVAAKVLEPSSRFLLIVPWFGGESPNEFQSWLERRLGPRGYSLSRIGKMRGVEILVFDRK